MMQRVPSEFATEIRHASHDAQIDAEEGFGTDWASIKWINVAIYRHERLMGDNVRSYRNYCPLNTNDRDEVLEWRKTEVKRLKKLDKSVSPLAAISDEELLAECKRRGF